MDPPESAVRRPRRGVKRKSGELGAARASEERRKQQQHAGQIATLGGEDARVRRLEELVFGAEERLTDRLAQDGSSLLDDDDDDASSVSSGEGEGRPVPRRAAWEDEDDELEEEVDMTHRFRRDLKKSEAERRMTRQKLQQRLREQFQKAMGGRPSWAEETVSRRPKRGDQSEDEDEDGELLRRTGNFIGSSDRLPKGSIKIKKCLNANNESPCESQLTSVQFHPSAQIVMTAALDHSISLFQVDGKSNPKIQTIHLENFPVKMASFSADGEYIVATGFKNKRFYIYDMMEGKIVPVTVVRGLNEQHVSDFQVSPDGKHLLLSGSSGALHLMTTKSREVIRSMRINGNVCAAAFTSDGSKIFTNSEEGEVFVWDVRSSRCLKRFADDGCVRGTALALSSGSYLACGSQSGVVNVYSQQDCLLQAEPKPLKAIMNLLTPVTSLSFNHSDEILAIASRTENEANRLVHLPSFSVFSNFPQFNKKTIYQCRSLDFSPRSGFYSVANNKGHALLFRLLHYNDF